MKTILAITLMVVNTALAVGQEVNYKTSDGIRVYAEYTATNKARGLIILFHQANGSRGVTQICGVEKAA